MKTIIKTIITIITVFIQFFVGHILAFVGTFVPGIGNGWELIVWPFWNTVGVWGIGAIAAKLRGTFNKREYISRLLNTAIGSAIGIALILITPGIGYVQLLFPLLGALIGFYLPVTRLFGLIKK